jgi:hypothetical protein
LTENFENKTFSNLQISSLPCVEVTQREIKIWVHWTEKEISGNFLKK